MTRITWFCFLIGGVGCSSLPTADTGMVDVDVDGDGFSDSQDCDDNNPDIYPGAPERCELPLQDTNCDGHVGGVDDDNDGVRACDDCNDADSAVHPEAQELCDTVDNDCDGLIDDADTSLLQSSATLRYQDLDQDGFGDIDNTIHTCEPVVGFVEEAGDCNDDDDAIHPDAIEVCDFEDNDCDGRIDQDDDVVTRASDPTCYEDADGDGYGNAAVEGYQTCACSEEEAERTGDCNDKDQEMHPDTEFFGQATTEGHFDYNCDGVEEHHYEEQSLCELDSTGEACTFHAGWVNGTPDCGVVSGVMFSCTLTTGKGTRPATGTGGTGSTGGTSAGDTICEPKAVQEQALCR